MSDDSRHAPIQLKEDQNGLGRIRFAGLLLHLFLSAQPWPKRNGWPKKSFFRNADAADVVACLDRGADPIAREPHHQGEMPRVHPVRM